MIKVENIEVYGWEAAIRGMRNPMNSWSKSDSFICGHCDTNIDNDNDRCFNFMGPYYDSAESNNSILGSNDLKLMQSLIKSGTDHSKFMRMITVTMDITAPLYLWKEWDTYKVGTVANSCSTMHKIAAKEFKMEDFSTEHLTDIFALDNASSPVNVMEHTIFCLNFYRDLYLKEKDKRYWWQMIQLLPSSYNQKRTVQLNYQVLRHMYFSRKNHKLDEWHDFCHIIEELPYAKELITLEV